MYRLTAVTKTYKKKDAALITALQDVDLLIEDGEWLAIQGRTGHGKSTLLAILGGLDRPTSGTVELDGKDLATLGQAEITSIRARMIGFVFQGFNLIPTLSAAENVEAGLIPLGMKSAERRARVAEALESVKLSDRADHLPSELSGGQQQRVGIARALAKRPSVLLADEPTGNLDEDTRNDIINLLDDVRTRYRLTLVMVTHDTALAYRAPRVGIMRNGRLAIRRNNESRTS
jgi:putative ABC transport system ATP-binding protein